MLWHFLPCMGTKISLFCPTTTSYHFLSATLSYWYTACWTCAHLSSNISDKQMTSDKMTLYIEHYSKLLVLSTPFTHHPCTVYCNITTNCTVHCNITTNCTVHCNITTNSTVHCNITVLFADDTSILITGSDKTDLDENINQAFQKINNWFNSNRLALNLNKTQFLEFRTNHFFYW